MAERWTANAALIVREFAQTGNPALADQAVDIARRFPQIALFAAAGNFEQLFTLVPEYVSLRKLEAAAKRGRAAESEEEDGDEETVSTDDVEKAVRAPRPSVKVEAPGKGHVADQADIMAMIEDL